MKLEDYKNRKQFTVPKGYFETLNSRIKEVTCGEPKAVPTRPRRIHRYASYFSYAAMFAIIIGIAVHTMPVPDTNDNRPATARSASSWEIAQNNSDKENESEYIDNVFDNYQISEYAFYCYLTEDE